MKELAKEELSKTQELVKRNQEMDWPDLSEQKRAFALNYVLHYNHRKAAEEVHLNPDLGLRIVREPLVAAYIKYLQDEQSITNFITEDFVRTQYLNLLPKLMGEEEVAIITGAGDAITECKFFPGEATNVIKELAKSTKFYEDGSGNAAPVQVNIDMGALLGSSIEEVKGVTIEQKEEEN
jgi:hypothetical protein